MKTVIRLLFIISMISCSKEDDPGQPCSSTLTTRVGAKCVDGTTSSATGSGACSSHGGVEYWLCK
jgi:hypothetical protein